MVERLVVAIVLGLLGSLGGAMAGLAAAYVLIPLLGIPAMEGQSGMFAMFVCVPLGAMAGFVASAVLYLWKQGVRGNALTANVVAVIAVLGAMLWGVHSYLSPAAPPRTDARAPAPQLMFEIRMPAGATLSPPYPFEVDLLSADRPVRAALLTERFRRDDDRAVIVGTVEILYRASQRNLILNFPGQPMRWFAVTLPEMPQRSTEFGAWQQEQYPDQNAASPERTYHFRYRVTVPGA